MLNGKDYGEQRSFSLAEEVSPDGNTHGGYGYLQDDGNLHFVEYVKDPQGNM